VNPHPPDPNPRPNPARLVATDLDGTLLRRDGTVSARTRDALRATVAAGVDVVLVTARPPRYLDALAAEVGLVGHVLCANGAMVYDLATREVVKVRALAAVAARVVVAALSAAMPGVGFAVETGVGVVFEPGFAKDNRSGDLRLPAADHADMWRLGEPIVKLLAWTASATADELLAVAMAAVGDQAECTHSGGGGLIEVSAAGVSKVAALSWLCAERGIEPAEVVAFGDMPNDLAMLRWAGTGYAVANAHESVLAGAAARTASNDDDGVALVLERMLARR
jgi:Cof subfamily protein (haloacid dehalogenase superfamily)